MAFIVVHRSLGKNERVDVSPKAPCQYFWHGGSNKGRSVEPILKHSAGLSEFRSSGNESLTKGGPFKYRLALGSKSVIITHVESDMRSN